MCPKTNEGDGAVGEQESFLDLIQRVRAADEDAAADLVRRYEPQIRRVIRIRMTDPGVRRVMDSMDICQSVMASFFVRAASGQYELETPEQLIKLLATMARNKVVNQVHKQRAIRRDVRRMEKVGVDEMQVAGSGGTPSMVVHHRELLSEAHKRLSDEERELAERRASGEAWSDIAKELGGTPDGLRMRLNRALDRVAGELGLDE